MAKEFKGFGKVPPRKQLKNASGLSFDKLRQNIARSYGEDITLLETPDQAIKMSEVLENFVSPYMDATERKQELQILFSLGVLAWNIALEPVDQRAEEIEKAVKMIFANQSAQGTETGKNLILELIDRKDNFFDNNQRRIVSFDLNYVGLGEYYISVASSMPDESAQSLPH